jgi:hypothetical protein
LNLLPPAPDTYCCCHHTPQGLDKVWVSMGADRLEASMAASRAVGIEPSSIYARLMSHPTLGPKLNNKRVLVALMDCCR